MFKLFSNTTYCVRYINKLSLVFSTLNHSYYFMDNIIKEKISADHLLYVSLKYTKTSEVIQNLIFRWTVMIENAFEKMLKHAKKKKLIKTIPGSPKPKLDLMRETFKDDKVVLETIELYEMFRRMDDLKKEPIGEFRKNVALNVTYRGQLVRINLEKLKEYSITLENFISFLKQFLSS